ncbi:dihydrolipoyllysine-residue succinyltransferase, partial [Candidatus Pelagibacter sp.]|nr:dihydrolipoyllysine-residue succinyltransferase [Candidatus Pelagibacter sp.]
MSEKIVVPALGESITEATVAKWLKNAGDSVDADEPIVELETDKVNLEVPSPITGVLTEINSKDGSVVEVGALLGSVSENGSGVKPSTTKNEEVKKQEIEPNENNVIKLDPIKKEPKVFEETLKVEEQSEKPLVLSDEVVDQAPTINNTQNQTLSPAVRKIV